MAHCPLQMMRADGILLRAELDDVRAFFNQQFGRQFTPVQLLTLKHFLDSEQIPTKRSRKQEDISSRQTRRMRQSGKVLAFSLSHMRVLSNLLQTLFLQNAQAVSNQRQYI